MGGGGGGFQYVFILVYADPNAASSPCVVAQLYGLGWVGLGGGWGWWGAGELGCMVAAVVMFYPILIMDSALSLSLDALIRSESHDFIHIL